jgi:aconitase A
MKEISMAQKSLDSFNAAAELKVGDRSYKIFRLDRLEKAGFKTLSQLPVSLKVLLAAGSGLRGQTRQSRQSLNPFLTPSGSFPTGHTSPLFLRQ